MQFINKSLITSNVNRNFNIPIGDILYIRPRFRSIDGSTIFDRLLLCLGACQSGLILLPASSIKTGKASWITSDPKFYICPTSAGFHAPTYFKFTQRYVLKFDDYLIRKIKAIWKLPPTIYKQITNEIEKRNIRAKSIVNQFIED